MTTTNEFLAECYQQGVSVPTFHETGAKASHAADAAGIRFVDAILMPDDGIMFFLFEADAAENVLAVMRTAGVVADRVVRSVRL